MGNFCFSGHLFEDSETFRSSRLLSITCFFVRGSSRTQIYLGSRKVRFFRCVDSGSVCHGFFLVPRQKKTLKEKDLHSPRGQEVTVSGVRGLPS